MGDGLAAARWYDENPVVQALKQVAYEQGVAAGREQAAQDVEAYAEKIRSSADNPTTGIAVGSIVDQAAQIARGGVHDRR